MKKVAIVILNWNGKKFLQKYFPVLLEKTNSEVAEIIIADNNSTDDSIPYIQENFPEIRIIKNHENLGFAGGYNIALKNLEHEYFLLINSDIEVTDGYLEPLLELMESSPHTGACMPKIKQTNNNNCFEYAGAAGGFIDIFGYPFCRGRILHKHETDQGQYNNTINIFWASGAFLMIRSKLFKDIGGFDQDYFAHMEEIDLCWRIHHLGMHIKYCPKSTVYHVGGGTLPNNSPFKLFLNYRNSLFTLYKNLPSKTFLFVITVRLMLDGISGFIYLIQFKFTFFYAVIKAHIAFYQNLPDLIRKRKDIQPSNISEKLIYNGSILWDFFVRKKHAFTQLDFH